MHAVYQWFPKRKGATPAALLSTGGLFAPAVTGFLVGSAATTTLGFTHAFLLTALLPVVVGALSTVLVNQQRDRAGLGLVD
ncbi:hypothetical protein ACFYM5_02160 [Streptomyces sp. NPDC006706]|uniref:hypothetical protein n=1 Tax=Streptomyces sp. NPDC006706 TaxID=3364761 RepID=UPI003678F111